MRKRRKQCADAWYPCLTGLRFGRCEKLRKPPFPLTLHQGEREAILLTEELHADVLLIDEQIGRTIALSRNLPLSGTLGVLERADTMGFLGDFPQVLRRLKGNGFFIGEPLEQQLPKCHYKRRGRSSF
jgi:predicted nucleic acid-binding protein